MAQHGERGADARGLRAGAACATREVDQLSLARHPGRLQRVARALPLGQLPLYARDGRLQRACPAAWQLSNIGLTAFKTALCCHLPRLRHKCETCK